MQKRILLVDDEPVLCLALARLLTLHKYQVDTANTMEAAWNELGEKPFDLVILDIGLAGRNGLDFLPGLKEKHPDIPVLILTAFEFSEELVQEAAKRGASGYIIKSLPSEQFLMEIRRVLNFPAKRPASWDRQPLGGGSDELPGNVES